MLRSFRLEIWSVCVLLTGLLLGGCQSAAAKRGQDGEPSPPDASTPSEAPLAPAGRDLIDAAIAEGDLNEALNSADRYLAEHPDDLDALLVYGGLNLDFADQLLASGQGSSVVPGLWADAETAYLKVAERRPNDPAAHVGLARARRMQGRNADAWNSAERAIEFLDRNEPDAAALAEIGNAGLALTIEAVSAGEPVPSAARLAERAFRRSVDAGNRWATLPLSDILAWQGLQSEGRDILVEALVDNPDWVEAIQRLRNLAVSPDDRVADLELARTRGGENPTLLWYLGEARFDQNIELRRTGDFPRAHEALDRAEEAFLLAMNQRDDFAESCQAWLHLVRTARGWTLREEGRVEEAGQAFVTALEADPLRLEPEPAAGTLNLGVYAIIDDYFTSQNLVMARAFLRRVTEVHGENPDWTNNLGFACRDLGVATQSAGNNERANELFRESWTAYSRCVELSPNDARLVNDRALIAVYYLDENWETAESELHRAIELGDAALAVLPETVTQEERNDAEEAVGDAWENLAYLDVVRRGRIDRAPQYLENSERYYPHHRRMGVERIRQTIDELKRLETAGPSEEPDNAESN